VDGDSASPLVLTCPSGFTETAVGIASNYLGCCNAVTCSNDYRTCASFLQACDECSIVYTNWLSCPQSNPACVTYTRGSELTSFACGQVQSVIGVLATPTNAASTTAPGVTNSASAAIAPSNPTSEPTGSSGPSSSSTSGSSSSSSSSSGGGDGLTYASEVGTIVAAVFGGLTLVGGILTFCFKNHLRRCFGR